MSDYSLFHAQKRLPPLFCFIGWLLLETVPKGEQDEMGHLEVLSSEGDADDGDAIKQPDDEEPQGVDPAKKDRPDDVQYRFESRWLGGHHGFAKWPDDEAGELEELNADGDANDGDAPAKPLEKEGDGGEETAENDPDDVAKSFHFFAS